MELKKLQDQFESWEVVNQFYSNKKLFKVFEKTDIWLKTFENNKGFYVCVCKLEVGKIWFGIYKLCFLNCSWCEKTDCYLCQRHDFIIKQYWERKEKEKKLSLGLWRIYLNTNKNNFEIEHVFKSD